MPRPREKLVVRSIANDAGRSFFYAFYWEGDKKRKFSTGIVDDGKKASHLAAWSLAKRVMAGELSAPGEATFQPPVPVFAELADGIWDPEKNTALANRLILDPESLSPGHLKNMAASMENHVLPILGLVPIDQIDGELLDALAAKLRKAGLSASSVKHAIYACTPVWKRAISRKLIRQSPVSGMSKVANKGRPRDALTPDELHKLLDLRTVQEVWGSDSEFHPDFNPWVAYAVASLCFATGARLGSVMALDRDKDFTLVPAQGRTKAYYRVRLKRKVVKGLGVVSGSKTGEGTEVPVLASLVDSLFEHLPAKGRLFPGKSKAGTVAARTLARSMSIALERIGLSEGEREKRLLGFHSLRHSFVSRATAAGFSPEDIAKWTEHKNAKTAVRYTHLLAEDRVGDLDRQKRIIG